MNKILIALKKASSQMSFFSEILESIIEKIEKYFPSSSAPQAEAPLEEAKQKKVKLIENAKSS